MLIVLGGGVGNIDVLYTDGVEAARPYVFNNRFDTVFSGSESWAIARACLVRRFCRLDFGRSLSRLSIPFMYSCTRVFIMYLIFFEYMSDEYEYMNDDLDLRMTIYDL